MGEQAAIEVLKAPLSEFKSRAGRTFTVGPGVRSERSDTWGITYEGKEAGKLYLSKDYAKAGNPRWHATIQELYWLHASDAPTGIGFDVAAFDSAGEALAAWSQSADEILDWEAGKPVACLRSKHGVVQKSLQSLEGMTARGKYEYLRGLAKRSSGADAEAIEWALDHIHKLECMKTVVRQTLQATVVRTIKEAPLNVTVGEVDEEGRPIEESGPPSKRRT